jgi:hypothetical protein
MSATDLPTILSTLADEAAAMLPSGHTGSGDPLRRRVKIVNGHRVQAIAIGWGEMVRFFEVDHSTEALTLAEATARVAA